MGFGGWKLGSGKVGWGLGVELSLEVFADVAGGGVWHRWEKKIGWYLGRLRDHGMKEIAGYRINIYSVVPSYIQHIYKQSSVLLTPADRGITCY